MSLRIALPHGRAGSCQEEKELGETRRAFPEELELGRDGVQLWLWVNSPGASSPMEMGDGAWDGAWGGILGMEPGEGSWGWILEMDPGEGSWG